PQRVELLRGIMDTDGTWNKARNQCVYETVDLRMANDVSELALSLGQRINRFTGSHQGFGKSIVRHRVTFSPFNLCPFAIKTQTDYIPSIRSGRRVIVGINKVDSVPTRCIMVDSPSATYLCGKS